MRHGINPTGASPLTAQLSERPRAVIVRPRREPFFVWPGRANFTYALLLALPVTLWWVLVYHGADWLTGWRSDRVRVHLDVELAMPFVPACVLAYLSLDLVFLMLPFVLRTRSELRALAVCLAAITAVAGVGFVLVPAELAYPPQDPGGWAVPFAVARAMALRYNLVPSLHVAMGCVCLAAYGDRCGAAGKMLLAAWAAAIVASTLLAHQHHLLDVATGLGLAGAGKYFIYDRWRARSPAERTPPPTRPAGPGQSA
jgi:membrane-associated phospholipid phosphatase